MNAKLEEAPLKSGRGLLVSCLDFLSQGYDHTIALPPIHRFPSPCFAETSVPPLASSTEWLINSTRKPLSFF